jgi:hypothetical protein
VLFAKNVAQKTSSNIPILFATSALVGVSAVAPGRLAKTTCPAQQTNHTDFPGQSVERIWDLEMCLMFLSDPDHPTFEYVINEHHKKVYVRLYPEGTPEAERFVSKQLTTTLLGTFPLPLSAVDYSKFATIARTVVAHLVQTGVLRQFPYRMWSLDIDKLDVDLKPFACRVPESKEP